jgi:hypothetical protein
MLNRKRAGLHFIQAAVVAALVSVGFASQAEVGITDTEIIWGNSKSTLWPQCWLRCDWSCAEGLFRIRQ